MKPNLAAVPGVFVVARLTIQAVVPESVWRSTFCSVTRTAEELSVVCEAQYAPKEAHKIEKGWSAFRVTGELYKIVLEHHHRNKTNSINKKLSLK